MHPKIFVESQTLRSREQNDGYQGLEGDGGWEDTGLKGRLFNKMNKF